MLLYLCKKNLDVRQETRGSRQLSEIILAVHLESTWPAVARWAAVGVARDVTNKTVAFCGKLSILSLQSLQGSCLLSSECHTSMVRSSSQQKVPSPLGGLWKSV